MGYVLFFNWGLFNYLFKEGYGVDLLKLSGLFLENFGVLNDRFCECLMFLIYNNIGDVIVFGGRILESFDIGGKYVNFLGMELYIKGKEFYGFYKIKYNISKMDYLVVCEGYFDFLWFYEYGFVNFVVSLGIVFMED